MLFASCFLKKFLDIKKSSNKLHWCKHQNVDFNVLKLALNINQQLVEINQISKTHFQLSQKESTYFQRTLDGFRYCFTSGFFQNSGRVLKEFKNLQIISTGILVNINNFVKNKTKSTTLFLFYELLILQSTSLRGLTSTNVSWLLYFGGKLFY